MLAAPPARFPIETLTVEGNHVYTKEQILSAAGLKIGQLAGKEEFEAARDRLVATGAFETVGYRFAPAGARKGYAASFQVTEAEPVLPVRFERLGVPEKELAEYLRGKDPLFGPRMAGTKQALARYTNWIQEYVTAHGGKDKIIAKVMPLKGEQLEVVFRPERTEPAIAEITFEGNSVLPASALQNAISEVAVGSPYSEERFRQLLDGAVRPLYDARGRIRVSFPKVTVSNAADVEGLAVKVTVNEGPSYDLGEVRLEGAPDFSPASLLKTAKIATGDIANFDDVSQGIERIKKVLRQQGYMRCDIQVVRHIDDRKKTVDLVLRVEEGPQFLFGKLMVEGLDLNAEAAIRKLWTIKEGDPFKAGYPDFFLNRVRQDNIFDNLGKTRSEAKVNEKTQTVDVTLYFEGGAPAKKKEEPSPF